MMETEGSPLKYMYVLYALIFLVVCLFIYSIVTRRKIYKEVDRLDEWKMEISNKPIPDEIGKVKGLKMSGETEQKFEYWRSVWDDIVTEKLPALEENLIDIEEFANKYRFKKAKRLVAEVSTKLENIENELNELLNDVQMLINSEEKNREEITDIRKSYYEVRKYFSVHRGSFGKTAPLLEERLDLVYEQFPEFDKATEEGNYLAARSLLETMKTELTSLDEMMKEIPKILVQLESHIPGDITNLSQGLKEMEEDGYAMEHFSIEDNLKEIEKQCEVALEKLYVLEIDAANERLKEINEQIDSIYDALELEVKSRASVLESLRGIHDRLMDTKERLDKLHSETVLVQQSYRITEEELRHQQFLSKQLKELTQRLVTIDQITEEKKQSYTSIHEMLVDFHKEYDELEKSLETASNKLAVLRQDELKAKDTLRKLKGKLLEAKRKVQKSNIPGLPESIADEIVFSERCLNEAFEKLAETPLDMNGVTKKVEEAVVHVETAINDIDKIVDLAKLAEILIQYGNRYRSYSAHVDEQLREAELAFREFYYEQAIEIAEKAISPYENNVVDKVKELVPK